MTAADTALTAEPPAPAEQLTLRVLSALLREDVLGLRTNGVLEQRPDGPWLTDGTLALPVAPDGFQGDHAARLPVLEVDGTRLTDLAAVLARLADRADPQDRPGHLAFAEECRQTLATMELHDRVRPEVQARLAGRYGADVSRWTGPRGALGFEALAAFLDHPVYPTARGRSGLTEPQLCSYAPEFHPTFELRWLAVPAGRLTVHGDGPLPSWWPSAEQLGVPGEFRTVPIHPLTAAEDFGRIAPGAVLCPEPYLDVLPTLSMRTVAVVRDPSCHLKLPLATATLGLRNRRTIKPVTLVNGAVGQRLVEAVAAREPRFAGRVLHADEQHFAHADDELLAVLLRRYPDGLDGAVTVPLAALLAGAPDGRLVIDQLADRFHHGCVLALYEDLLRLLVDWQTTLFGHGIALESHQQNTSLVLDDSGLRLLYKDNDGPRINTTRTAASPIGELAALVAEFRDPRILGEQDRALTDLFTTITGHLCTASLAFGLAEHGRVPLERSLELLRAVLTEAVDRLGPAGQPLRAALLDAQRLPVKAMVSAGSLLSKERSGAADINKHYTDGPNYLLPKDRS
ncbi:IucA/IucC family protein [Streptomyces sp. CBMA123]|uniref:IucA/IucC family protein n=1 Tax=Streptomyces sp. CBMA123 TaxID=1896313 RepID=UPI001661D342|nr:IucA/IucC family protein [Streptomyces sp. CBMA123]MBD0690569.1 siderophore biosynthesis protein [Streptomyces sp. CBMA123]